jgi:hypothetical protein
MSYGLQEKMKVTFKVNYKTEFGECISLIGETEKTGNWKDFSKSMMKWTDGDWWELSLELDPREPFMYKYVVIDHASKTAIRWE